MCVCVCAHVKLIIQESVIGRKLVASLHFNPLKSWNILMIVSSNSSRSNEMFRLKWPLFCGLLLCLCVCSWWALSSLLSVKGNCCSGFYEQTGAWWDAMFLWGLSQPLRPRRVWGLYLNSQLLQTVLMVSCFSYLCLILNCWVLL